MTLFYKNYNTKLPNRTLLKRTIIIICLFFAFSIQAQANYTGDKPLIIHTHDTITGDLVYTDPAKNEMEYWIAEGCDYLSSKSGSGLTPEKYVTQLELSGSINLSNICEAELTTVVQSGCHENNSLIFNHKNWTGLYNGTPYADLDINNLDVRNYLTANNNIIKFRAVDDYMAPGNVFLVLKHTTPSSEPTPVPTDNSSVMSLTATIEPAVSIEVSPVSLNFGTLGPDTIQVIPEVTDTAQDLFVNGLLINNTPWSNYQSTGDKEGTLIFLAQQQ